jgi:hypothetical protein
VSHIVSLTLITGTEHSWRTAFSLLSQVALDAGEGFTSVSVRSDELSLEEEDTGEIEEFFDENTLFKIHDVVRKYFEDLSKLEGSLHGLHSEDNATDLINSLQNAGILFREIKK